LFGYQSQRIVAISGLDYVVVLAKGSAQCFGDFAGPADQQNP
jgi:hypothetical protein